MTDARAKSWWVTGRLVLLVGIVALVSCSGDESVEVKGDVGDAPVATTAAGRDKSMSCLACHGAEGVSDYDVWPDLAGQSAEYLAKQLRDFRDGRRHDPWMSPMAVPLSDEDIEELAAYFGSIAGLTGGPDAVPPQAATCVACHSDRAGQANPLWPSIGGQNRRYLVKQLTDFRDGRRNDPSMVSQAVMLTDEDIETLATFYAGT